MTMNGGNSWRDIEYQLGVFLAREARREASGKTIEKLFDELEVVKKAQVKLSDTQESMKIALRRVAKDRLEDKQKIDVHGRAIKTLQAQVELLTHRAPNVPDWRPDASEITGMHAVRDLQKAQAELEEKLEDEEERKREESTWWKRQGWIWAFAVFSLVVGGTLNGCMQIVIHRLEKPETITAPVTTGR